MRREKAKADEEAAAETNKYKSLYDSGVSRIGKLQQEVERLKMEKDKAAKSLKACQTKSSALEDQLESFRAHSVRLCAHLSAMRNAWVSVLHAALRVSAVPVEKPT